MSHFYGARRTVGYVPFNSESLVQGRLFEDIRDAVYETAKPESYDAVVVVAASPQTQLDRLVRLRGMAQDEARARIAAQAPLEDKLAVATHVIHNDGPLEELAPQVERVWAALQEAVTAGKGQDAGRA